jgi:hypothetical protein
VGRVHHRRSPPDAQEQGLWRSAPIYAYAALLRRTP